MPDSDRLGADAALLFEAVREAGDLALQMARRGVNSWRKADGSAVSDADLAVDRLLHERLAVRRPAYGWLSEETPDSAARLAAPMLWIVDPIDGTRGYIAGGGDWCVAAALVRDGRAVAAAIHLPMSSEFFTAIAGQGALCNGAAIDVTSGTAVAGATVAGPRKAVAYLESLGMRAAARRELPLQLRLAFVAAGRIDAAVSLGPKNDWDLAAGDLMVREAGGMAGTSDGAPYVYNRSEAWQQGLIAAGRGRHAALVEALSGL